MSKRNRKPASKKQIAADTARREAKEKLNAKAASRRRFIGLARNVAIALPVVGIGGFFAARAVQASMAEGDLTRIGQGLPAVVQIHDPQCASCATLQAQTRRVLKPYGDDEVTYLVANLTTEDGLAFATRHGVSHVTLVLFDPDGDVSQIVRGPLDTPALQQAIDGNLAMYR